MKEHIGHKMNINNVEYEFNIDEFPVWTSDKYVIYSPVNFEDADIHIALFDQDSNVIDEVDFLGEVGSFEDYCRIVGEKADEMISKYESQCGEFEC